MEFSDTVSDNFDNDCKIKECQVTCHDIVDKDLVKKIESLQTEVKQLKSHMY